MMRIFKKNKSVPQLIKIGEFSENRQDMECNPKPIRDFFQPVHQNPTPKDKRRTFLPRVGKVLRRLFCCGKKKKIHRDPEEINWIPSAITEDNETISEKKTEATSSTDSAHQQTAEKLGFAPTAEVAAASIDEIQLSIPTETLAISESGTKITSTTDNEYDQKIQIQSTNAKDIVETVPSLADGTEPKTTTDRDPSLDSTVVSANELEFTRSVETVAERKDQKVVSFPTETVSIPESVIGITTYTDHKLDQKSKIQYTNAKDIVETVPTPKDGTESTTTTKRDPSSDSTYEGELKIFTAVETVAELKDWIEISIPTDTVIKIPSSTSKSDSEDTPQSTDPPDIVETTTERDHSSDTTYVSTGEIEFFTAVETMAELKESTLTENIKTRIMKYVVKIKDLMTTPLFIETESAGGPLKCNWKLYTAPETTSSSRGSQIIIPDRTCASEEVTNSTTRRESGQSAQQTSTPVGIGQSLFSKSWAYFFKNKEREEEKEEKEVSQIQSDVPAPLTAESFKYHILIGQGAFGKVFVASHPAVDQLLAIKIAHIPALPPEAVFAERHAMEATGGSRFFPQLYATFHTEFFLCYVMEFVNGGILQKFIDKRKPMDINIIRFIAAELLCAIQFLHARGIAHCDLHSSNILVDATGHIKIIDFGLASISKIVPCQNDRSSTFPKVVPRILKDYSTDYLSFEVLLEEMARTCPDDTTKLQDFICKVSTFSKPTCSNLRHHPFFTGINWDELEAGRISPPYSMKPIPAINRSLEIGVNKVFYYFKCVFLPTRTFSAMQNDQEFDFVSDRWKDMQQHH